MPDHTAVPDTTPTPVTTATSGPDTPPRREGRLPLRSRALMAIAMAALVARPREDREESAPADERRLGAETRSADPATPRARATSSAADLAVACATYAPWDYRPPRVAPDAPIPERLRRRHRRDATHRGWQHRDR